MMPFFALSMLESRLLRSFDALLADGFPAEDLAAMDAEDLDALLEGQGYNEYIFKQGKTLSAICMNDKSFEADFDSYLKGFDPETRDLLGVDPGEGDKFLDIRGVSIQLRNKKLLFDYAKEWSEIDLKPFDNSAITTLEEHIKRRWADISAETAGEQYTPDDVIALIAEIIASKIEDADRLLKIYDCTCGGGNLLFGVEDRIQERTDRYTATYGQDQNDALFALARIESRFREDSQIEHGNTLTSDKFDDQTFDVVIANPPYGVSWKGFQKDIRNDKTGRFHFTPSVSDGQLLFMQHLISKLNETGMGVVVHNGSTLFSGDAGSAESNIRKWMLDSDIVEALIQLPTDEFFNTGIHTYLWVLNKQKAPERQDKVMLINASGMGTPLKKNKGSKRREVDGDNRQAIVDLLAHYEETEDARIFEKEFFYFNKQAIELTNVDDQEQGLAEWLTEQFSAAKKSLKLTPVRLSNGERILTNFVIEEPGSDEEGGDYETLADYLDNNLKPFINSLDYKEQPLVIETAKVRYWFDPERETLMKGPLQGSGDQAEALGCGKIEVKALLKKKTKTKPERIEITVELKPDLQKDYEIIPYHRDPEQNQQAIANFMDRYITRPFVLLDNVVGVEINFNKVFYKLEALADVGDILDELKQLEVELANLEEEILL